MRSTKHTKQAMSGRKMAWLAGVAGAITCIGVSALAAGQAQATVYLSNNFNNNGSGLGTNWSAPYGGVTDTGTESAFTNITGGNSALLTSTNTNTNATVLDSPTLSGLTTSDPIQISFDFDITAANSGNNDTFALNSARNIILNFGSPSAGSGTSPGAMVYKNGSAGVTTSFTPSLNTWYRITLGLSAEDAATPRWSINVASVSNPSLYSAAGISFSNTMAAYASFNYSFNTLHNNGGGEFQIDNVLVATPEPTVFSLLGLGTLGLLILQPRHRPRA